MADALSFDLVSKHLMTDQIVLYIGYDRVCLEDPKIFQEYKGKVSTDHYGRKVPRHANGTINLSLQTAYTNKIVNATMELFDRIVNPKLLIRRISITAGKILKENQVQKAESYQQFDLFSSMEDQAEALAKEEKALAHEKNML